MTPRESSMRRWLSAALGAFAILAATGGVVLADGRPTKLSPGDGAVLATRPAEVSVETGEEMSVKAGDNDLVVRDSANAQVTPEHATVAASRKQMSLQLPATLPVGTYTVQWFTVSGHDGHAASGKWSFTYDPSKPASAGTQRSAIAPDAHDDADVHADDDAGTNLGIPLAAAAVAVAVIGGAFLVAWRRG